MGWMRDENGLDKNNANYVPLTPLSHINRAAQVFPNKEAVIYGNHRKTWLETHNRCSQLANVLADMGVISGDVVATVIPNLPAQVEAHFGIPACGAVLNTINTRLEEQTISYIFSHGEAKVVLVDTQFLTVVENAINAMEKEGPKIIEVADPHAGFKATGRYPEYEELLKSSSKTFEWLMPKDEWESISLNYTSGTTGRPKGVVSHHRGSYLMTMGTVISWKMTLYPKYLTIVPLFHCNGWNHTWMMPLLGGTIVCCRDVTAEAIYNAISEEGITHFGGAPIVLNAIVNATSNERKEFKHKVEIFTAGAPPAAATLAAIEKIGFSVTQVYGLTETYGHVTECLWNEDDWGDLPDAEKASIKSRQGVLFPMMEEITVLNKDSLKIVPSDGETLGEIAIRGNSVMKGYYKNEEATLEAFQGGFFHSGDIAKIYPDSHIQIADRAKDIIISGGENVSSVEIEGALMNHPSISLCAVVAMPDKKWGEVPCAFIELKDGENLTETETIKFVRKQLAGFKTPKKVIFQDLPKTSTGKIQKFQLREKIINS